MSYRPSRRRVECISKKVISKNEKRIGVAKIYKEIHSTSQQSCFARYDKHTKEQAERNDARQRSVASSLVYLFENFNVTTYLLRYIFQSSLKSTSDEGDVGSLRGARRRSNLFDGTEIAT